MKHQDAACESAPHLAFAGHGMLQVGQGHEIWYEQRGRGIDALILHGGPGSGTTDARYALFDTAHFRVMRFDQRGCGRSRPLASETLDALAANTTQHLIADIETLRIHLGVTAWVVFGGSWGTTLALAYAQAHPTRVRAMVLAGVATTSAHDLEWLYGQIGNMFPEAFAAFCSHMPEIPAAPSHTSQRIAAFADRLRRDDTAQAAADAWCTWETAICGGSIHDTESRFADPAFRLGFARIVTHYFAAGAFLDPDQIERDLDRITHIPCRMIHSRFDPSCPLRAPWQMVQRWPAATFEILDGTAHSALDAEMTRAIRRATDALSL